MGAWRTLTETGLGGGGGGAAPFLLDLGEIEFREKFCDDSWERIPEESCSIDLIPSSLEKQISHERLPFD